ncbi:single hybrid motif-containing protein [Amylocystis lapponica]|nr:single hybrid motif-containing protein [Amylocystis lapponica]
MQSIRQLSRTATRSSTSQRWLQTTSARRAVTNLQMPAMSPTMTEGGIASWKKKEGEAFAAGDVLLEIETDKATIDVEAPDDGVMGKILLPDGTKNIPVGRPIALIAEEGDDISNLQAPPDAAPPPPPRASVQDAQPAPPAPAPAPSPTPAPQHEPVHPTHARPLFPSVLRLLAENGIGQADAIAGTGVRGMLTKGDVLAYLGKASGPLGTFREPSAPERTERAAATPAKEPPPLDGAALRRLIVSSMLEASVKARMPAPGPAATFDSIIADYLPETKTTSSPVPPPPKARKANSDFLDGLI